jgi:hypothetical protein
VETKLRIDILRQPDDETCGPTCLHAMYRYYGTELPLTQVISEVPKLDDGGTLAVLLGCHALKRDYTAKLYTYNLPVFDPTWFELEPEEFTKRLRAQMAFKTKRRRLQFASQGYIEFLELGGKLRFEDLTTALVRRFLNTGRPIITGLSSTYLHRSSREFGPEQLDDDIRGEPAGHFVILAGYNRDTREVLVADPLYPNPLSENHEYLVSIDRVICAILLGVVTHDANLLIIEPRTKRRTPENADPDRRQ